MFRKILPALLIFGLILSACAAPVAAPASEPASTPVAEEEPAEPQLQTVRVGHVPVTIYSPFYIAAAKGYFEDEGIAVEFTPVDGGTENVVQVAAGTPTSPAAASARDC